MEQFVLRYRLVDDFLRAAEEERSRGGCLRLVCPARHGNSVSPLMMILHPPGLEVRVRRVECCLLRGIDKSWRSNRDSELLRIVSELRCSPAVQIDERFELLVASTDDGQ